MSFNKLVFFPPFYIINTRTDRLYWRSRNWCDYQAYSECMSLKRMQDQPSRNTM